MYFCYLDESGTPDIPGNSSHYVLSGLSIPIHQWKTCDGQIERIKKKYGLLGAEIHTAWILRKYIEQIKIVNFELMDYTARRNAVEMIRKRELLKLQKSGNIKHHKQTKKNYRGTEAYIHLTYDERVSFIREVADQIGKWGFARIFAECIDKIYFNPALRGASADEQALEQLVSRFEKYIDSVAQNNTPKKFFGALIHDNNDTVCRKHTQLMKHFHKRGTLWTQINHIIETPLFVNSELTSLVQIADLCAYALRRYFENSETDLLDRIKSRFDKRGRHIVGLRHFTDNSCKCILCDP